MPHPRGIRGRRAKRSARFRIDVRGHVVTWHREGAAAELEAAPTVWRLPDFGDLLREGTMTRLPRGWRFDNATRPFPHAPLTIRIEAVLPGNRSEGLFQQSFVNHQADQLFEGDFD